MRRFTDIEDEWQARSGAVNKVRKTQTKILNENSSFADTFLNWENAESQKAKNIQQKSSKKANAPTKEEKEAKTQEDLMNEANKRRINPIDLWLNRFGTVDKDSELDEFNQKSRMESREYLRTMKIDAKVDLHGLTRDEAWSKLESFVNDCARLGFRKILIVHGKGNHTHGTDPVLGNLVRSFIEHDSRLGTSGQADHKQGGNGATWVILKN